MNIRRDQTYDELDEASDQNTSRETLRIRTTRELAKRISKVGRRFNEFTKHSDEPIESIRQCVDDDLPWQAGRYLCEAFDHGLFDVAGFSNERHSSDLRLLSPVWCAERLETLRSRPSTERRLGLTASEPPDPKLLEVLQGIVDCHASSTEDRQAAMDRWIVRVSWWSYIRSELQKTEEYRTRLGTKVESHWAFVESFERMANGESPLVIGQVEQHFDDANDNGARLRLQTAARIQAEACEILAEVLSSIAAFDSYELQRQVSHKIDAASASEAEDDSGADPLVRANKKRSGRKRGRPKGTSAYDVDLDRRIFQAWKKGHGQYKSKDEMDGDFGVTPGYCKSAIDRERKRKATKK